MKLYHFTSILHLPHIKQSGFINVTESNIHPILEHFGPDVVWLTDLPTSERGLGLKGSSVNKQQIRFTVEVDAQSWRDFANANKINRSWYRTLDEVGGYTARNWYVSTAPIFSKNWLAIDDMISNTPIK